MRLTQDYDGGSSTAYDNAVRGTNYIVTTTSERAAHGTNSSKHEATASTTGGYDVWTTAVGGQIQVLFLRFYINVSTLPASSEARVMGFYGSGAHRGNLAITTTGTITFRNAAGSAVSTTTATLTLNTWSRYEAVIQFTTSGRINRFLYNTMDSVTHTETATNTSLNLGGTVDEVRVGNDTTVPATYYLDDVGITDTGFFGSAGVSYVSQTPVTTAFPVLAVPLRTYAKDGWTTGLPVPTIGQLWPRGW